MANKLDTNIHNKEEEIRIRYGQTLNKYIKEANITQAVLAREVGSSQASISDICNGNRMPGSDVAQKIQEKFGLSETYISEMIEKEKEEPLEVTQIKNLLDTNVLSKECLDSIKYMTAFMVKAETHGDLSNWLPAPTDTNMPFASYGWDFTLRFAMDTFKERLAGRIAFNRIGLIRRKTNDRGVMKEAFIAGYTLPLWINVDEHFQQEGTYTIKEKTTVSAMNDEASWAWVRLIEGPREDSRLFITRQEPFSDNEFLMVQSMARKYMREILIA
mgnify:CR=1 FL=1|tara:strand:- start:6467 stop:7285 length:819 start_codon:yes stop_codon:yes gene_type:complete